ncbi:MAG: alkaline phosphatase [Opitutales bacterium]
MSELYSSSRRRFIKGAGLFGGASFLAGPKSLATEPKLIGTAKNLIFLVADGMGVGTLSFAHHWQMRQTGQPLEWMQLLQDPNVRRCLQDTASANSPVTDSAAAGSAWGCGERVNNRSINYSTRGQPLKPLFSYAKESGRATGLVSTCRITHATPAAFVANVANRDAEDRIADQYLERGVDVLLGGGAKHFSNEERDLCGAFIRKGYVFAENAAELAQTVNDKQILGLFTRGHLPYAIDRKYDARFAAIPSLATMFKAALQSLGQHENGFVLQVEAGRIDHAGHANDPASILHETLEFDRCIPIALDYYKAHPDTLIIVTTDHGTGGCQLNGTGKGYQESGPALDRINRFKGSFQSVARIYEQTGAFDARHFEAISGLTVNEAQIEQILHEVQQNKRYMTSVIADVLNDKLMERTAIGWTSNNHTAEHVELAALGPGSAEIPMFLKNYELHGMLRQALNL